ncbi:MAG: hypothetical protein ACE367_18220 [Acidimicrobiales bacterium]
MRKRFAWSLSAFVLVVGMGFPTAAGAQDPPPPPATPGRAAPGDATGLALPDGWAITDGRRGAELTFTLDAPLPITSARPEFRSGDLVIGHPDLRGDTLVLAVDSFLADLLAAGNPQLSLWLGARRLDAPGTARDIPGATDDFDPTAFGPRTPLDADDDPGAPGPYRTRSFEYDLAPLDFKPYAEPLEVVAEVIAPRNAPGPRPVVLFIHGRHATCYVPGDRSFQGLEWPCSGESIPIPSHRGYRYVAELLASQGYVTVSISANAVNAQDFRGDGGARARSALIRHHLGLLADWNRAGDDAIGGRLDGALDMDQVVLVGHSRGGEGVERAAVDTIARNPWTIVGIADIAPTAFGRQTAPGITRAVLLPYCDGDVVDLQGQTYVDNSRDLVDGDRSLRSAVMILGANHNFFNTEWTPRLSAAPSFDDGEFLGPIRACDARAGNRLTPRQQQRVGATYIAALAAVATERDPDAAALLDGSDAGAPSAGPATVLTHALGANRTPLFEADVSALTGGLGVDSRICDGIAGRRGTATGSNCAAGADFSTLPHWLPFAGDLPRTQAWDIRWRRAGDGRNAEVRFAAADLRSSDAVELRIAADPAGGRARFAVRVGDARGVTATLGETTLVPLPGKRSPLGKVWAQTVRMPLTGAGIDRTRITSIEIVPLSDTGRIWVLDAHGWRPGVPAQDPIFVPQVSVGSRTVAEGDDGVRTVNVRLKVRGAITEPGEVYAVIADSGRRRTEIRRIALRPGVTPRIPIEVTGDTRFSANRRGVRVTLLAGPGATTGRYQGALRIREDDPAPTITLTAPETVAEGDTVVIRARLSAPVDGMLFYQLRFRNTPGADPVDTDDFTEEFLLGYFGMVPDPAIPVGSIGGFLSLRGTTAAFRLPLRIDDLAEGDEGFTVVVRPRPNDPLLEAPVRFDISVIDTVAAG